MKRDINRGHRKMYHYVDETLMQLRLSDNLLKIFIDRAH